MESHSLLRSNDTSTQFLKTCASCLGLGGVGGGVRGSRLRSGQPSVAVHPEDSRIRALGPSGLKSLWDFIFAMLVISGAASPW